MTKRFRVTAQVLICVGIITCRLGLDAQKEEGSPAAVTITEKDLAAGLKNPTRWLTFSGDLNGQRHSPLKQLTAQNVSALLPQWILQTDVPGFPGRGIETSPIVVDGTMYVTGNSNTAWALDARTGATLWRYKRTLPTNFAAFVCCGPVNRGFAILGDRLYMGTLD